MGNTKKIISIILILSFLLSLIPDFSYNEGGVLAAECPHSCSEDDDCTPCCKSGCTPKCSDDKKCYCVNCPIACQWTEDIKFENKSCLPIEGAGEWRCGTEIPIGEIIDETDILASKMAAEFERMIETGRRMVEGTEDILNGRREKAIPAIQDWSCSVNSGCKAAPDCYKYLDFKEWELIEGPTEECSDGPQPPSTKECEEEPCQSCAECLESDDCRYWETTFAPDPEETITCRYKLTDCEEECTLYRCAGGCAEYLDSILSRYSEIQTNQQALVNDIDQEEIPEKLKRDYILEQLNFSRCELAKCFILAKDMPDILAGKKVGRYLFTCETVKNLELLEPDQMTCFLIQAVVDLQNFLKYAHEKWEEIKDAAWWKKPFVAIRNLFQVGVETIRLVWKNGWELLKILLKKKTEEACYPTNYYCCEI